MVTTVDHATESTVATAAPAAESAAVVDISAIPETPAELLRQWEAPADVAAPRRPLLHVIVSTVLVRIWDAIVGPPMTDRQRVNRELAEHRGRTHTL